MFIPGDMKWYGSKQTIQQPFGFGHPFGIMFLDVCRERGSIAGSVPTKNPLQAETFYLVVRGGSLSGGSLLVMILSYHLIEE